MPRPVLDSMKHATGSSRGAGNGTMHRLVLNGKWTLRFGPDDDLAPADPAALRDNREWPEIPAGVPGNVELDLIAAGLLPELTTGNRVYEALAHELCQWWYTLSFATPVRDPENRVDLVFDGLDCFATVWVNDRLVGTADNMLIPHRFDVTDVLRRNGRNTLCVRIRSATRIGRNHRSEPAEQAGAAFQWESLNVRKAPHMYGWDIMPRLVSAGIWRDASLELLSTPRLTDVHWNTVTVDLPACTAQVTADWTVCTAELPPGVRDPVDAGLCVRLRLKTADAVVIDVAVPFDSVNGTHEFVISDGT